jgi:hypothetical protein
MRSRIFMLVGVIILDKPKALVVAEEAASRGPPGTRPEVTKMKDA